MIAAGQNNMQVVNENTSMHKEFIGEYLREVLREGEFRGSFPTNAFLPDELGSMMQAWNLWNEEDTQVTLC